jgi:hypothetical protein
MKKQFAAVLGGVMLAGSLVGAAGHAATASKTVDSFRPLTTFHVPNGGVAEIMAATPDGSKLLYTNAGDGNVGIVDLNQANAPKLITAVPVGGEPTSIAVTPDGKQAIAVVIASKREVGEKPVLQPGKLVAIDIASGRITSELSIGTHPDSIALASVNGALTAVVAIENEPVIVNDAGMKLDEDAPGHEGDISEPGFVQVITLHLADVSKSKVQDIRFDAAEMQAKGLLFPEDPQPEFVDIKNGRAAVTLQENNGFALIDVAGAKLISLHASGIAANQAADLKEDARISMTDVYPLDVKDEPYAGSRMSDAIAWNAAGTTLYTADEGEMDFTGGRGWSAWSPEGKLLWTDRGALEQKAVSYGQYPDGRSEAKGIEIEGLETGVYGNREFAFVGSERGSFVAVYDIAKPASPRLIQLLPTGMEPEGLLAVPQRNLFLTSDEASGTIDIYEGVKGRHVAPASSPTIVADAGVSWSAISGLAADAKQSNVLYAVPDVAMEPVIYKLQFHGGWAKLAPYARIREAGQPVSVDMEGIVRDTSIAAGKKPGFWLASEGNAAFGKDSYMPNELIQVDAAGNVLRKIALPQAIDSKDGGFIRNNGFEGIAVSSDGRYLVAAIQREYAGDEEVNGIKYARIARYDLKLKAWDFFLYPLETTEQDGDWIGLSEIINIGKDTYAVIERDKMIGSDIKLKAVYTFTLKGLKPFNALTKSDSNLAGSVVKKQMKLDVSAEFSPFEKVEGLAVTPDGSVWAALDNDGGEVVSRLSVVGTLTDLQ